MSTIRCALALLVAGFLAAAPAFAQTPATPAPAPAAAAPAAAAEDEPQVFNAFAIAVANGTIVRSGEKQVMVVGTVSGPMFIETDEGPMDAGSVTCAAAVRIDQQSKRQAATGACTFIAHDNARAWGDWECAGYELIGCRGSLKLTGGSGRFEGITGEGAMVWRPSAHELRRQLDGTTLDKASGILIWRNFKIAQAKK